MFLSSYRNTIFNQSECVFSQDCFLISNNNYIIIWSEYFFNFHFAIRLVFDRETGKPKGYGFCEYKDQETALSAIRNLNGYELNGRALRVDSAASEKNREEMKG